MDSQNKCQGFRCDDADMMVIVANADHMFNFELKPTRVLNRVGGMAKQEQHDEGDVWPHRLRMTNKLSTKLRRRLTIDSTKASSGK